MAVSLSFPIPIPPALLHAAAALALAAAAHFLHLPSLFLYALHTYIHPDAVPSNTPRAVLRPPGSDAGPAKGSSKRGAAAAKDTFDATSAQLYRLRLSHSTLASRPHFGAYHAAFLLPLALLPPALLLPPASAASPLAPLVPAAYLFVALLRHVVVPSPRPAQLAAALGALLVTTLISSSPFAGALASLAALPAARFARAFWLGTDQPRTGLAVLASSAPARLLLYLAVLVSSVASILQCCGFVDGAEQEVRLLAAAAGLQLLAARPAVQMYLNEAVFCWYQRLHASRAPDTEYGRAKVFLHNHHLCAVATQLVAPPLLVLSLLALWRVQGKDFFEGLEGLGWLVGWSVAMKEAALLAARWVVAVWSAVTVITLVCYKRGWLFVL
ncbi:hypothetical protein SEVIR_4G018200v4 [Setaria viridis]|uniref:Uncharacterized protein n=2 Tax=Setaria TaxID=4554 RepID=A0A368QQE3_SETIT|nr:uncharacterized protein LOC101783219 [Setaria italica]XP_034590550.1 uncharacterized protein LOC117852536 [Setaria viridis]RCV19968.1 hypothetical protein SETIT_4G018300v2 [Setaria italica]TKW19408.1 hypothetical protein SEVIR_4G018200v2 [Setaria viridis]